MKKYDFTVFGCATSVTVLKVDTLPEEGKTVWVNNTNVEPFNGGVGFNISANLASLGARVHPVLSFSDNRLDEVIGKYVDNCGWPTDGLLKPVADSNRMCIMFQDNNLNHATVMYRYGKNCDIKDADKLIDKSIDYLSESKMVILASPRPKNTPIIFETLMESNTPYVFSYRNDKTIFPPKILHEIIKNASMIFMNHAESLDLLKEFNVGSIDELFEISKLHTIVTTLGAEGCKIYHRENGKTEEIFVPITKGPKGCVDGVGAGDAFLSGFMYGYINGKSLTLCGQYGSTMSSFAIEKEGSTTNIPTLEQMLERNASRPDAVFE